MAGGGTVWIADRFDIKEKVRVVDGRMLVTTQGGGGGTGDVNIVEIAGNAVAGPNLPVDVLDVIPGVGVTNLGKQEDEPHVSGATGVMLLAVRNEAGAALAGDGDYIPISVGSKNGLAVEIVASVTLAISGDVGLVPGTVVAVTGVLPGATNVSLGKLEDAVHASGDLGVMALGVRQDTPAALAGTDGDYQPPIYDGRGAQWVRSVVMLEKFSDSVDGTPIQITGTTTGTANDIHDSTANEFDRVTIDATNTGDVPVELTIEWGGTGTANEIVQDIPARSTIPVVKKTMIGGDATVRTISAYAAVASVINLIGFVERNV